jgi:NAD(P)-dependent dehydrogenase (short-subunit alcohol dehydrogenase family)
MESIRYDLAPYGVTTMIVEPGFFRTELLVEGASTTWPELSIDDYADRTNATIEAWKGMNGKQGGDPAKLAAALITLADSDQPPLRWVAGADAVQTGLDKANLLIEQVTAHRELSSSLAHDDS